MTKKELIIQLTKLVFGVIALLLIGYVIELLEVIAVNSTYELCRDS